MKVKSISKNEIEQERKNNKKGEFENKIFLEYVEENKQI